MPKKKIQTVDTWRRIEAARKSLHLNHGEMMKELGVSRSMYYYIKSGERELGNKAALALDRLEDSALKYVEAREHSEQMIKESATAAEQYGSETEKNLAFHANLAERQADELQRRLVETEQSRNELLGALLDIQEQISGVLGASSSPPKRKPVIESLEEEKRLRDARSKKRQ
jgi:transcriptional regulator with XRE-family HTH domain